MNKRTEFMDVMSSEIAFFVKDQRTIDGDEGEVSRIAALAATHFPELDDILDVTSMDDCLDFVDAAFDFLQEGK